MADLTVLIAPTVLYSQPRAATSGFSFPRPGRSKTPVSRPRSIMVTLEKAGPSSSPTESDLVSSPDQSLLSPPINTWKSAQRQRTRHRPTRSQSAPPSRTYFERPDSHIDSPPLVGPQVPKRRQTAHTLNTIGTSRGGELLRPAPPLREFLLFSVRAVC